MNSISLIQDVLSIGPNLTGVATMNDRRRHQAQPRVIGLLVQIPENVYLIASLSIYWESGNAFSAMLKRYRISNEDAIQVIIAY